MSQRRLSAYLYLLLTAIIWGAAGPVIKFTLGTFPPLIFLSYRFALSTIIGFVILRSSSPPFPRRSSIIFLLILSGFLTSTIRLGLLFFGFNETTSLSGSLIAALSPMFMSGLGILFFHEHVTRIEKIGMSLAFIGTLISIAEPVFAQEGAALEATLRGNVIVFISVIADVLAIVIEKYIFKKGVKPVLLANLAFILGFFTLLPLTLYHYSASTVILTITNAPVSAHLGVWYMAFISGTLAYTIHGKGLKRIEMGEASVFTYLTPIFAAPLSLLWLGEKVSGLFAIGAVIIFLGVGIAEYKRRTG